jgi:mRNA interferase MazF
VVARFEVHLVNLDPTEGREMKKTRPCVVVSPDELNEFWATVIVAPMTSVSRDLPFRVDTVFDNRRGQIALDQIRSVDKSRLVKKIGRIRKKDQDAVLGVLREMFG